MFENVNFENSYFSDCLFHDITINNCKGLKNAFFENINFETIETPVILSDEKALQYLLKYLAIAIIFAVQTKICTAKIKIMRYR